MEHLVTVLQNDNIVYFDVDDTLVMWEWPEYLQSETILVQVSEGGPPARVLPHKVHIAALKRYKQRNQAVVVWSQGGFEWAAAVVSALHLGNYVDVILRKPCWYYDDLPAQEFMGQRVYQADLPSYLPTTCKDTNSNEYDATIAAESRAP